MQQSTSASLLFSCPDQIGIIASIANYFSEFGLSISRHEEHTVGEIFFSRLEWTLNDHWDNESHFCDEFSELAKKFSASYSARFNNTTQTLGLLVSSQTHAMIDVLNKSEASYFPKIEISFIVGSDDSAQKIADRHAIPFFHISNELEHLEFEQKQLEIINRYKPNYLGLSTSTKTLSANFLQNVSCPVIGINNSFLPAFSGSDSYQLAFERGVKLIGATAYFVTAELNQGPIIEQGVLPVDAGVSMQEFMITAHNIEQAVFTQAISKVLEHKVLVDKNRTIVFN